MFLLTLKFLLVHLIGDFVLQPSKWVVNKQKKLLASPYLYLHLLVHLCVLVMILGDPVRYWLGILITIVSHFSIDLSKLLLRKRVNPRLLFFADQLAHVLVILGIVNFYEPIKLSFKSINDPRLFLAIISLILVTEVASILMKVTLSKWTTEGNFSKDSLASAGKYIGILERLLVFFFTIVTYWHFIGFLLAAKSVFRFGDLTKAKDRKLTEYILIGTLLSFGIAIIVGSLYKYFLKLATQ